MLGRNGIAVALLLPVLACMGSAQTASGSIEGHVVDQNNAPIVDATVYPVSGPSMAGPNNAVKTDSDGLFRIFNLSPGTYTLTAFKTGDGYGNPASSFYSITGRPLTQVAVSQATLASGVQIQLGRPGGTLHVMAYDANTHKPLLHATYALRRSGHPEAVDQGEKDLPANFLVPATDVTVELFADGYQPWTYSDGGHDYVTVRPGETRDITANMVPKTGSSK